MAFLDAAGSRVLVFLDMAVDWKRFILILAAGVLAGFAWNAWSGRGIVLGQSVLLQAGDELVKAPDAKRLLDAGALFLDARPRDFWRMSRIPGSLALPEEDFERAFPGLAPQLRRARAIVVYCSGYGCEASHVVARKLRERGFDAAILDEGLPAWEDAHLPLDTEPRP
jgi:rhodanese-related sulfurtransferase